MNPRIELLAHQPAVCSDASSTVQLLIRVRAPRPDLSRRPALNVGLSIDRSGSMGGEPMQRAIQAGCHVVQELQPSDTVSVVAFNSLAQVVAPYQKAEDRQTLLSRLGQLSAGGGTNLFEGWLESCRQVAEGGNQGRLSRVLLLSDGGANEGVCHPLRIAEEVARWQSRGVTTTTIGLGANYNEDLMSAMARAGNGSFYHVQTPEEMVEAFQVEMLGLSATFGQAVSLGVLPSDGVQLTRVYNVLDETPKGRFKMSDLVHGCPLSVVVELQVEPQVQERELCRVRLAWTEVESEVRRSTTVGLKLPVVPRGALSEFPLQPEVAQQRALKLSARLLSGAIEKLDCKDRDAALASLESALDALREADPCSEIEHITAQVVELKKQIENGQLGAARKQASYSSSSISMGSVVMSGFVRAFLALPPDERTPEKLEELKKAHGW
ncbi:VWA domain-containing protein [bacterium]|nr:VWA domain-containing protein [bacterium]